MTSGGINAYGISIRFQSIDFSTTSTGTITNTYSLMYPTLSATRCLNSSSHPLPPGAQAGIGIGVALLVLGLLAFLGFFIFRHRRLSGTEPTVEPHTDLYKDMPQEMEGTRGQHELYGGREGDLGVELVEVYGHSLS